MVSVSWLALIHDVSDLQLGLLQSKGDNRVLFIFDYVFLHLYVRVFLFCFSKKKS